MNRRATAYDILERVGWTALQGFLAAWIVIGDFTGETFKIAATAAAVSAAKCILASRIGTQGSASTLPEHLDP